MLVLRKFTLKNINNHFDYEKFLFYYCIRVIIRGVFH